MKQAIGSISVTKQYRTLHRSLQAVRFPQVIAGSVVLVKLPVPNEPPFRVDELWHAQTSGWRDSHTQSIKLTQKLPSITTGDFHIVFEVQKSQMKAEAHPSPVQDNFSYQLHRKPLEAWLQKVRVKVNQSAPMLFQYSNLA